MTRIPKKKAPARAAKRRAPAVKRIKVASRSPHHDPLDDFIAGGAIALGLKIDKSWMSAVRSNLEVTLKLGALVAEMALPDEADPAPVFKA